LILINIIFMNILNNIIFNIKIIDINNLSKTRKSKKNDLNSFYNDTEHNGHIGGGSNKRRIKSQKKKK
jgi:hypothetical protein